MIGILEEIDSFIDQKYTNEKVTKNWGRAPPSFGQNPKEQQFFSRETVPKQCTLERVNARSRFQINTAE